MSTGDNGQIDIIKELKSRIRSLEERMESYQGFNWESLRPAQVGGFDLSTTDDDEVKRLALELKAKRSEITDVKKLHMVDMMLHFFSVWPLLPQVTRRYAYNMGTLLIVAVTEGWNEATQRSNGFSPQLVAPVSNGHQTPEATSSIKAEVDGIQAIPVAGTPVAGTSVARTVSTSGTSGTETQVLEPASMPTTVASPPKVNAQSPAGTPVKRPSEEAVGATSPKVASYASTSSASSPHPSTQSPNVEAACPLNYKPKCDCKQLATRLQVKKDNHNKGRYFYKCSKSTVANQCEFFEWEDKLPLKSPKNCSHCSKPGHNKNNCPKK